MTNSRIDLAGEVDAFVTYLTGASLDAGVDVGELQPPCVWVAVRGVALDRLAGYTVDLELVCIVPNDDPLVALGSLSDLSNAVVAAVDVVGDITPRTVTIPGSAPLPALVIPTTLDCDYLGEPAP